MISIPASAIGKLPCKHAFAVSFELGEIALFGGRTGLLIYDMDFERIGCWLCPAALQSEFASLKGSHPQL